MTEIAIINGETWLVCGGRDFADQVLFDSAMADLTGMFGMPAKVVHGAARGLDSMADDWGRRFAIDVATCPADWHRHGNSAGPIRNAEMLMRYGPQKVIAFPGGRGTADMVARARSSGVDVIEIRVTVTNHGCVANG